MYWPCHGDQDEFLRNGTIKYILFPRNGTIKYFFNPFNVISPGIIIIWYQLWYFTSTHLQVCGCIWGLHTEPVCWGPSWRGLWTWLVGSSTCHCWTPQTDRCWSHQSSIQEDLQRHREQKIFLNGAIVMVVQLTTLCYLKRETEMITWTQELPSMVLGSESRVLVLHLNPSPVPSIQMYIAWTWSPWGRSMYCCFTVLLSVELAEVAMVVLYQT